MNTDPESGAGLIALAIGAALALNYPLLSLFDREASVFGIPLAFVHLFVVWAVLIAGIAALVERRGEGAAGERDDRRGESAVDKGSDRGNVAGQSVQRSMADD